MYFVVGLIEVHQQRFGEHLKNRNIISTYIRRKFVERIESAHGSINNIHYKIHSSSNGCSFEPLTIPYNIPFTKRNKMRNNWENLFDTSDPNNITSECQYSIYNHSIHVHFIYFIGCLHVKSIGSVEIGYNKVLK